MSKTFISLQTFWNVFMTFLTSETLKSKMAASNSLGFCFLFKKCCVQLFDAVLLPIIRLGWSHVITFCCNPLSLCVCVRRCTCVCVCVCVRARACVCVCILAIAEKIMVQVDDWLVILCLLRTALDPPSRASGNSPDTHQDASNDDLWPLWELLISCKVLPC